jgi:hypothetical protein
VGDEDPITYDPLRMRDNVIVLDEGHIRWCPCVRMQ